MTVGITLLTLLGPALGKALYDVGKEKAVEAAAQATGLTRWENLDAYTLRRALHHLAEEGRDDLRNRTVAAALAMTRESPDQVPKNLLRALDVDQRHRPDLARFLWAFRKALAKEDERYWTLVQLSGEDEARALLRRLAGVVRDVDGQPVIAVLPMTPAEREIEETYLNTLVEDEFRYLPLKGRRVQSPEGGLRMRLENVYIALNTTERPEDEVRMRGLEFAAEDRQRQEPRSALRVVLDHRHLLLLGEPGSGKTTFAEHLALCLAGERRRPGTGWAGNLVSHDAAWDGPAPLPVRIRLREFGADEECLPEDTDSIGRARHLLAYVDKYLGDNRWSKHLPDHAVQLINRGQAFLVLDGLDEVADPHRRRQVAEAINDLADRCADLWVLVTCRVAQYPLDASGRCAAEWALPRFHRATLADFTPQQIERFADRWFGELYSSPQRQQVRREKAKTLKVAIRDRPDLQGIAPRPILLTQMALVHDAGELPGTRVELYGECTRLLLWEWERIRAERAGRHETADQFVQRLGVPGLQRLHLQRTLDHAVFEVHEKQGAATAGPVEIPSATLLVHLTTRFTSAGLEEPEAQAKAAVFVSEFLGQRNGLIVPAGELSFQTPHRTIQEFLAARHLQSLSRFHREAAERVRDNYDLWREVVILAVGQAGRSKAWHAVDAIHHLCPEEYPRSETEFRHLILAGEALAEVGTLTVRGEERGPDVEQRVVDFLKRAMQDLAPDGHPNHPPVIPIPTRYAAAETLDRLGWLPPDLDAFVEIPNSRSPIYVARYPVTNAQFERFIAAGGYENPVYWGGEESDAWRWRAGKPRYEWQRTDAPDEWDDPRFGKNRRGYPVVGVSWYEANAYCRWLTEQLRATRDTQHVSRCTFYAWRDGEPETLNLEPETLTVRLPTEAEWIAAAGGAGEDRYPWGPNWDEGRANTSESGIDSTSPVAMYPAGWSEPYGVGDMGGNVWEWTASRVEEVEREAYALRGGSWLGSLVFARVSARVGDGPDHSAAMWAFGWWFPPLVLVPDVLCAEC